MVGKEDVDRRTARPDRERREGQPDLGPEVQSPHGGVQVQPEVPRVSEEGPFEQSRRVCLVRTQPIAEGGEDHGLAAA